MGTKTGIEWTDSTWSPIRFHVKADAAEIARAKGYSSLVEIAERMAGHVGQHCEHISEGCRNCYAEINNHRCLPANGTGLPYDRRARDLIKPFIDEKVLLQPLKWKAVVEHTALCRECVSSCSGKERLNRGCIARPRRIFVENQSDLFAEWVTDEMRDRVLAAGIVSGHIFQLLTKRAGEMPRYFSDPETSNRVQDQVSELTDDYAYQWPYPNIWLGVSVENQAAADKRIPLLLQTPAAVRYVSCEPLVGAVDLRHLYGRINFGDHIDLCVDSLGGKYEAAWHGRESEPRFANPTGVGKLDWVICGGESGRGARPMHPDWARSLRDQCQAAGVPFFFKQWGEWGPCENGEVTPNPQDWDNPAPSHEFQDSDRPRCAQEIVYRVGKKVAGTLLDGREWKQFPIG